MSSNGHMDDMPWLVPQAVQEMNNFLLPISAPRILEWGAGGSTLWFSSRASFLYSIEHSSFWHAKVVERMLEREATNAIVVWTAEEIYAGAGNVLTGPFDLILVDGIDRNNCVLVAKRLLKRGGMLVLDNTEREEEYTESLQRWLQGWSRQDYVGECTTSLFIKP